MRELCHLACEEIASFYPKVAAPMGGVEAGALACLHPPCAHHRRLRTSNVQERTSREFKRRSRVVQAFPSGKSLVGMLGAVYSEMDKYRAARRQFTEESIAKALTPPKPTPSASAHEGSAEGHAEWIIDSV